MAKARNSAETFAMDGKRNVPEGEGLERNKLSDSARKIENCSKAMDGEQGVLEGKAPPRWPLYCVGHGAALIFY